MLTAEAGIMAVVGSVAGIVLDVAFAYALAQAVGGSATDTFTVPTGQIALFAALLGMLAAVLPARRAARASIALALGAE